MIIILFGFWNHGDSLEKNKFNSTFKVMSQKRNHRIFPVTARQNKKEDYSVVMRKV